MTPVHYELDGRVAVVTMDDGKVNAISPAMIDALNAAFDQARDDEAGAVVLSGRAGRFSGGFDLGTLGAGGSEAARMLRGGFELTERMLSLPMPVVVACTGHAIAMGVFLLCAGDYRVGTIGDFRIQANEVAIGLTVPLPALAILRYRLTPSAFDRAATLAESFTPEQAVAAGFLDRVVDDTATMAVAREAADAFLSLDPEAHANTKLRARSRVLDEIRSGIAEDFGR